MNYSNLTKAELIKLLQDRDKSTQASPDLPKIERGQIWRDSEDGHIRVIMRTDSTGFDASALRGVKWWYPDEDSVREICGTLLGTVELPEDV